MRAWFSSKHRCWFKNWKSLIFDPKLKTNNNGYFNLALNSNILNSKIQNNCPSSQLFSASLDGSYFQESLPNCFLRCQRSQRRYQRLRQIFLKGVVALHARTVLIHKTLRASSGCTNLAVVATYAHGGNSDDMFFQQSFMTSKYTQNLDWSVKC